MTGRWRRKRRGEAAAAALQDVRRLRDRTGAGLTECKRALERAGGNGERAAREIRDRQVAELVARSDAGASACAEALERAVGDGDRALALLERDEAIQALPAEPERPWIYEIPSMDPSVLDAERIGALIDRHTRTAPDILGTVQRLRCDYWIATEMREELSHGPFALHVAYAATPWGYHVADSDLSIHGIGELLAPGGPSERVGPWGYSIFGADGSGDPVCLRRSDGSVWWTSHETWGDRPEEVASADDAGPGRQPMVRLAGSLEEFFEKLFAGELNAMLPGRRDEDR